MDAMARALPWICGFGVLLSLGSAVWQGRLERGGPAHADVVLEGGIPATFYLPSGEGHRAFIEPPPRGRRPPAVALMHGFASDRLGMSTLARRLARAGYAVLAFDARGHGGNRNPFERDVARPDCFVAEYAAAVDFLRGTPLVDGAHIAVMGHSMGAGAALDFATRDSGIDAAVMISGGFAMQGPLRPPNALFLYASGDPGFVKQRSQALAARLAGEEKIAVGRRYGDPARGTAVRAAEVAGADHLTIIWSAAAAREIRDWLDAAFGRAARDEPVAPEPRLLAALLAAISLLLVLPGLGWGVGRRLPPGEPHEVGGVGGPAGLALLAVALLATMPLLATDTPAAVLSIEAGDVLVGNLALAGIALWVLFAARGSLPPRAALREPLRVAAGAALAMVVVYVLLLPIGAVVHRMTLTPERLAVFFGCALGLLPFASAFQWLLRRGSPGRAALLCGLGRALVLAVLVLGVVTGVLSFVVIPMLPSLVVVFVPLELLAAGIYAASRNLAAIALVEAAWIALMIAATMPVRV